MNQVKDNMYEAVSAAVDDAAEQPDKILKQIGESPELRQKWRDYHRIGDVIRGEYSNALPDDFAASVRAAIEQEPAILAPQTARPDRARRVQQPQRWVAGFAIAATVAVVSIVGLQTLTTQSGDTHQAIAENQTAASSQELAATQRLVPVGDIRRVSAENGGTYWRVQRVNQERDQLLEERLNMYLADHMEFATSSKVHGALPYSRLVGYDTPE